MVRAYLPQLFPNNIESNTTNPPQGSIEIPPIPPTIDKEVVEEVATVFDNLIYNETGGGNDGRVDILGG